MADRGGLAGQDRGRATGFPGKRDETGDGFRLECLAAGAEMEEMEVRMREAPGAGIGMPGARADFAGVDGAPALAQDRNDVESRASARIGSRSSGAAGCRGRRPWAALPS